MNIPPKEVTALLRQGYLLAVDPGMRYPAAALFLNGVLQKAERVKVPGAYADLPRGERCLRIVELIAAWTRSLTGGSCPRVVYEFPQVYRAAKSKGSPNDLIPLAAIGGGVASYMNTYAHAPLPAEWIGSIPKAVSGDPLDSPRGRLIWRLLSEAERLTVTLSHDSIDSIGLGLHGLGRLHRFV